MQIDSEQNICFIKIQNCPGVKATLNKNDPCNFLCFLGFLCCRDVQCYMHSTAATCKPSLPWLSKNIRVLLIRVYLPWLKL